MKKPIFTMTGLKYIVIALIFLLNGYSQAFGQGKEAYPYKKFIKELRETGGKLIDVRTPEEWDQGFLKGAQLIDFRNEDFTKKISELDRESHYFLYCRTGNRSGKAALLMKELGFKNVFHLKGGVSGIKRKDVLEKN